MDAKPKHSSEQLDPFGLYQNFMGDLVDLQDSTLLPHLENHQLILQAMNDLGYALIYMNYLHSLWPQDQKDRVDVLIQELKASLENRKTDMQYWRGFVYRIEDETENLL